jgi:hypothetical protein
VGLESSAISILSIAQELSRGGFNDWKYEKRCHHWASWMTHHESSKQDIANKILPYFVFTFW